MARLVSTPGPREQAPALAARRRVGAIPGSKSLPRPAGSEMPWAAWWSSRHRNGFGGTIPAASGNRTITGRPTDDTETAHPAAGAGKVCSRGNRKATVFPGCLGQVVSGKCRKPILPVLYKTMTEAAGARRVGSLMIQCSPGVSPPGKHRMRQLRMHQLVSRLSRLRCRRHPGQPVPCGGFLQAPGNRSGLRVSVSKADRRFGGKNG